jgi:hypothetical protein
MIKLVDARPNPARPDDLSGDAHRRLIGWVGLLLPALLVVIAIERDGLARWRSLESISAYYYTGAVAAFVGMVVALALFLFTYRGFDNPHHQADRAVAIVAGFAALAVAFFPTAAPADVPPLTWWTRTTGVIHHAAALMLFAMFAVFALWLFRMRSDGKTETTGWRNKVYLACGVAIVACIGWAGYNGYSGRQIFVPESIALVAFSFSWLVKGYAAEALVSNVRWLLRMSSSEGSS